MGTFLVSGWQWICITTTRFYWHATCGLSLSWGSSGCHPGRRGPFSLSWRTGWLSSSVGIKLARSSDPTSFAKIYRAHNGRRVQSSRGLVHQSQSASSRNWHQESKRLSLRRVSRCTHPSSGAGERPGRLWRLTSDIQRKASKSHNVWGRTQSSWPIR